MKKRLHLDSMVFQTVLVVISVIILSIVIVSTIIINISERIFVDTYGKSQQQVFDRIEEELNQFHEDIMKISYGINSSWDLKLYLQNNINDPVISFQNAYKAKQDMKEIVPEYINTVSIITISNNGRTYVDKAETITTPIDEILNSQNVKKALKTPNTLSYVYMDNGYTSTTNSEPVIMIIRGLTYSAKDPYGVMIITIKESDFSNYFEYFGSPNSDFYLVDENNIVVSSTNKEMIKQNFYDKKGDEHTILIKELPYYKFTAYGIINNEKALGDLYNIPLLWIICAFIIVLTSIIVYLIVRRITNPLSDLVKKMSNIRYTKFDEQIKLSGTREIKELANTYNGMLDDLNKYIQELLKIQKQKRKAEIYALQMQINPHYIYNTLASIKWLIFQNDVEKSTKMIDSFINLLRNTITNADEFVNVDQEIDNLKNYVLINNIRYGEKILVEYFVTYDCEKLKVPKMILQPFVENAFFHAFPYEQKGNIQIFVRKISDKLQIKISDDGIGMSETSLVKLNKKEKNKEHFSGIGINNVDDRLKLIYGNDYGITIESTENVGTTITINIPILDNQAN